MSINKISVELRDVVDPDLNIPTLRSYYNPIVKEKMKLYAGLEYGAITFKSDSTSGTGTLTTIFIGSEYKILPKLSLTTEFGYSSIDIKSSVYEVSGPEYIFNFGVSYSIL